MKNATGISLLSGKCAGAARVFEPRARSVTGSGQEGGTIAGPSMDGFGELIIVVNNLSGFSAVGGMRGGVDPQGFPLIGGWSACSGGL